MMLRAAQAARKEADFELDILGTGVPEKPNSANSMRNCGWIRFHGSVDQDAVADFMAKALALLVPSLWLEIAPGSGGARSLRRAAGSRLADRRNSRACRGRPYRPINPAGR